MPVGPGRPVADIWSNLKRALAEAGLHIDLSEKPQEVSDTTPFSENTRDRTFVLDQARRFHTVLCTVNSVFEEFRSQFFGRTGVQFWWGSFDLTVLLFSGRKVSPPEDRGYIMRYDLDAEHMNAGFWPGDDRAPSPAFYGYLVPQPPGCATAPMQPEHAGWVDAMGEWLLPYDAVRRCPDPRAAVLDFLHSVYWAALTEGGWDARRFEYAPPSPPAR